MAHPYSSAAVARRRRSLMPQPWKHPQSGMFYLRLRVPSALPNLSGRRHAFECLGGAL